MIAMYVDSNTVCVFFWAGKVRHLSIVSVAYGIL